MVFANPFEMLIFNLNSLGFFGFLLPWVFVFAVIYAILWKTKALGEDSKILCVISLVVAFFVIGFGGPPLGAFFVGVFGLASLVLAGLLVIIFFIALAGGKVEDIMGKRPVQYSLVGIGIVIFFIALGSSFGVSLSEAAVSTVFIIVLLIIAIAFVTGK